MSNATAGGGLKVGLMRRGDRHGEPPPPAGDKDLAPLISAFHGLGVETAHVVWADDALDELREQLFGLDGVIVWVNPIQDGATRAVLDPLLREVASRGIWVSAHPDVILEMGTKEILYKTRTLGWGSDTELYRTKEEFERRFPRRLQDHRRLVVKQGRGNGGNGVWKVELLPHPASGGGDARVRLQHARARDGSSEETTLEEFLARCDEYFAWSGCLIDQQYQERLPEGMVRCYFTHDRLVGFARQWPKGLLDFESEEQAAAPQRPSEMEGPDHPAFQGLRVIAEKEWVPAMNEITGVSVRELPVIWDADFLYGPRTPSGEDSLVLCEINVSAVLPFPLVASETIAAAATARMDETRGRRASS